jgi:hypothetical protein
MIQPKQEEEIIFAMTRRDILTRIVGGAALLSAAEPGKQRAAAQTPKVSEYGPNGDLRLTLAGAIARNGRTDQERSDLELDLERRNGLWEPQAWGFAYGFNTADHYGPVAVLERDDRFTIEARLTVGSDPWVPGSAARYLLTLRRKGNHFEGTYTGVFDNRSVSGKVAGVYRAPWPLLPPADFTPFAPGEHPRLVFQKSARETIRQRAMTDWGQAVLARLRETLGRPFVYVGDYGADSAYVAAGHAFLYNLTGDPASLAAAREITAISLKTVPMRKGHQYAYSHHLMGIALAYDFCYDGWDEPFRREVVRYLEETAALVIAGRGPGFNHSPGSNWVARSRGAAGMALVAIAGEAGVSERAVHLQKIAERSVARYLVYGTGDHGFGPEGDGYHVESMEMVFGMMQAYRAALGREMARGTGAEWTLPLYILRSFPGPFDHPLVHRYGRHGGPTGAVPATLFGLGLGSVSDAHRPAVRHFYDRYWGLLGDRSFGVEAPHVAPYALALYPEETRPQSPLIVLPRAVRDERKGFFVFRNEEFVTTVYAKSDASYGWNFPEAGTFRIHGFGTDWAIRAGVGTRDMENVALARFADLPGSGPGRVTHYEATPDGSGAVSMDLDEVYLQGKEKKALGIRSFRAFAVDYSGESGAPALFVLVDKVSGGTDREWLLHTAGKSLRQEGQVFVIEGDDGATLRGTFITPAPVRLHIEEKDGIRTLHARGDDPKNATFFVLLTIQRGPAPAVSVQGRGLSAVVTVGKQTIQYARDGEGSR